MLTIWRARSVLFECLSLYAVVWPSLMYPCRCKQAIILDKVRVPRTNPHGVPLRVRLYEEGTFSDTLIGTYQEPLAYFIAGTHERPPFYVYHSK